MRIFDFHTHTFPDHIAAAAVEKLQSASHTRPFTDGTVNGLRASMEAAGIAASLSLPVATHPRQVIHVNDAAIRLNQSGGETGVYSFGSMHPEFPEPEAELKRLADAGIRGIKLHPIYQGVDFDDPRSLRVLEAAGRLGLIVLIHAGWDVGYPGAAHAAPRKILNAVRAVGPFTLVLAHMGGWRCWEEAEQLLPDTGAYIDTSFSLGSMTPNDDGYYKTPESLALLGEAQFLRLVSAFGADRVLFGTDCPWGDQAREVRRFLTLPLKAEDQQRILWGNAARLLGG